MLRYLNILFFALFVSVGLYSQENKTSNLDTPDFQIEEFVLPGGQSGNKVNRIVQGPKGFLWFGSQNGLHRYDGYNFITYGPEPGDTLKNTTSLTYPYVENLYWDKNDKLWVSTYGRGVFRFDPDTEQSQHILFTPEDSINPDLTRNINQVMCMQEDLDGMLWFGTGSGLVRLNQESGEIKYYLPKEHSQGELSNRNVSNIYLDRHGTLWIGTGYFYSNPEQRGGLNRYDPKTDRFISFLNDPQDTTSLWSNVVRGLLEDSHGNFWVATLMGLQKMDRKTGRFERMYPNPNQPYAPGGTNMETPITFSLLEDQSEGIWVGTVSKDEQPSQLLRYDPRTSTIKKLPITTAAWDLCESKDGTIWVAGAGESGKVLKITPLLNNYDLKEGTFVFEDFKKTDLYRILGNGHPNDHWWGPLSLKFSPDGEMWLRYVYETFTNGAPVAYAILANYQEQTGAIIFHYLEELDLSSLGSVVQFGNPTSDWESEGLAFDEDGNVWGSYPTPNVGLFRFNPKTGETTPYLHHPQDSNSLASNYLTILIGDRRDEILAGHFQNGLSRFNLKLDKWTRYEEGSGNINKIGGYSPSALMEGSDGQIWIGGQNSNNEPFVSILDSEKNTIKEFSLGNFNSGRTRYFAESEKFLTIAVDGNGLLTMHADQPTGHRTIYNSRTNNFPLDVIGCTIFDRDGILWLSSHDYALITRADLENETWTTFKYGSDLLLQSRKGALSPQGHIYFPIINDGWVKINPKEFHPHIQDSSKLTLVDLYIQGQRQIPGKSKQLPMAFSEIDHLKIARRSLPFGVRFSAFHFRSPNVKYHYRLYPLEEEWRILPEEPEIIYSYVPTGNYQLQIRAYHMNGLSKGEINLPVVILPSWWQTWWAFALYFLTLMLLIAGLYFYQRRRWQLKANLQLEQERADRLKELDHFKSRFYTNITHEFRTPLTVIKGISNQIDGQEKIKTLIQRNSTRLLNLVNQLLDLSKLETNSLKIDWVKGDIIPYLQYLTESCHSLAGSKNINLAFFSKEESLEMDFDENKLQQILINLLSNAIKFTPEYGSVKVIAAQVIENGDPILELTVQDTGKGIPKEKIANIFNRFYQVDDSATRQGEGSGIGLALIKELVHLLEGRIEVKSEVGKGSSFLVYLPIHLEAQNDLGDALSIPPETLIDETGMEDHAALIPAVANGENPLVLIIEDNADVTEYIISCLSPNYNLQTARNGQVGLEIALEIIPDVILSDVMMPGMDGFEVCRRLKTDRRSSHIPIVLLTAKATQEDKIAGLTHGADAYLTKPFDKEELLIRLSNLAAQSKRLRERLTDSTNQHEAANEIETREAAFLEGLNEIIASNLGNELFDTNYLCRAIAMSRTQLHRKLKALTGQATANYIRTFRLQRAKSLLETTDIPIGEIASQVGFKDFSHFSRSFLKEFGVQPSETRK